MDDRVFDLFTRARRLKSSADRDEYLNEACEGDTRLRGEIDSLLEADAERSPLDEGVSGSVAETSPLPLQIDQYRILEVLGEGGMGRVFLAAQESPRRRVALKVLRGRWGRTEADRARFEREANILARLDHPGIARCLAARMSTDDGEEPYIALEYVEGVPLLEHAEQEGLSRSDRLLLIEALCEAVHYAHQRGVVHRDLKSANLLVDQNGRPRILDFGIARILDDEQDGVTRQGQVSGTLAAMSPEQYEGDPELLDIRVDVYALGVVAYELLTGRPPFDLGRASFSSARRIVQTTRPVPAGRLDPNLRGDVELILDKALATEPDERYASARELAADIRRHLERMPIEAHPPSIGYVLKKSISRHRLAWASACAALVAVVTSLVAWQLWLSLESARVALDRAALGRRFRREREARELLRRDDQARLGLLLKERESWQSRTALETESDLWRRLGGLEIWRFIHELFERHAEDEALLRHELELMAGRPTEPHIRSSLASALLARGDVSDAFEVLPTLASDERIPLRRALLGVLSTQEPESALAFAESRWAIAGLPAEDLDLVVFNAVNWMLTRRQFDEALALLDCAWRRRAEGALPVTRAWYRQRIGGTHWLRGDYEEAGRHFAAGLDELDGSAEQLEIEGELRNNLATTLRDSGRFAEAQRAFEDVVAFAGRYDLRRQLVASEINLARLLQRQGRLESSREHFERAWQVVTALDDGAEHTLESTRASMVLGADALVGLALLEVEDSELREAGRLLELAAVLRRARFGAMPHAARGEIELLNALIDWKERGTPESRQTLRRRYQTFAATLGASSPQLEHLRDAVLRLGADVEETEARGGSGEGRKN